RARQRGARVAEQGEDAALLHQRLGVFAGAPYVVAVVERQELELAAVYSSGVVHLLEIRQRAVTDLLAKLVIAARKRRRLTDDDGARRDALRPRGATRNVEQEEPQPGMSHCFVSLFKCTQIRR